jgi:hypothetical protein
MRCGEAATHRLKEAFETGKGTTSVALPASSGSRALAEVRSVVKSL